MGGGGGGGGNKFGPYSVIQRKHHSYVSRELVLSVEFGVDATL
jgi:hypothetical protein